MENIKPFSNVIRRNWTLYAEAMYAKKQRGAVSELVAVPPMLGLALLFFFLIMSLGNEDVTVALFGWVILAIASVVACVEIPLCLYMYQRSRSLIPLRSQELRLSDPRAAAIERMFKLRYDVNRALLDRPDRDPKLLTIGTRSIPERVIEINAAAELLDRLFSEHGDLGGMIETERVGDYRPNEVQQLVAEGLATAKDTEARERAMREVEALLKS